MARKLSEKVTYEYASKKEFEKDTNSKSFKNSGWFVVSSYEKDGLIIAEFQINHNTEFETAIYDYKTKNIVKRDGTIIYKHKREPEGVPERPAPRNHSVITGNDGEQYVVLS